MYIFRRLKNNLFSSSLSSPKKQKEDKKQSASSRRILAVLKSVFWFSVGGSLGLFLLVSFVFIYFRANFQNEIYPGVAVNGVQFGGKTKEQAKDYFDNKNRAFADTQFVFQSDYGVATVSAKDIDYGYNSLLIAEQTYSIGRSDNVFSNLSLVFQAYINGVSLPTSFHYSDEKLELALAPIKEKAKIEPVDALFQFENGRVSAFQASSNGQEVDIEKLKADFESKRDVVINNKQSILTFVVPLKTLEPNTTTDEVNNLGIKELIATGTSLYEGSIPNRIFNVNLTASRINGVLIAPNEEFSFNKYLGDVSASTGFKQAYVIENGKTVLGDGGGVCQVSTTLFRAVLNAGLPVTERHAHAYRVHYYEEDSAPGIDATVFYPSVDFKFKNTTGKSILIQTEIDPDAPRLTVYLYGTKDGREVSISKPVITSQTPAPEALYQDDPTLPKGEVKQVDFAAAGANVFFTREVKQNGKVIISDKYISNYQPWRAIFLKGTKES